MHFPQEVYQHLLAYLNAADCVSLVLSGISRQFTDFYGRRRKFDVSSCYQLTTGSFKKLWSSVQCERIRIMDVSHCYWISPDLLVQAVESVTQLQQLYSDDTRITIAHLPAIWHKCRNITHLSINSVHQSWHSFLECARKSNFTLSQVEHILHRGLGRLIELKLIVLSATYTDAWILLLNLLKWCRKCTSLHVETFFKSSNLYDPTSERRRYEILQQSRNTLLPALDWMANITSLVYIRRGCGVQCTSDLFASTLYQLVCQLWKPPALRRLWIQLVHDVDCQTSDALSFDLSPVFHPNIQWLCLPNIQFSETGNGSLPRNVTHIGDGSFVQPSPSSGSFLRYARRSAPLFAGELNRDLNQFLATNPRLEQLFMKISISRESLVERDWSLPKLRTLAFVGRRELNPRIIEKLVEASTNLEEVHICIKQCVRLHRENDSNERKVLVSLAQIKHLNALSLSGFRMINSTSLQMIFSSCSHLQTLHISHDCHDNSALVEGLTSVLHLARNLRNFRLDWNRGDSTEIISLLSAAVQKCPLLQKLAINQKVTSHSRHHEPIEWPHFSELVRNLVFSSMHLVCLCLVMEMRPGVLKSVESMRLEIQKVRPFFWLHINAKLPDGNDPHVPRIHYNFAGPTDPYHMPPCFP